jgi:imidazolonepropionase-like amidohydrolase
MGEPIHVRGVVLPEGERRDLYVVDGRVTYDAPREARTVAQGWVVPGLVDAHCHVGLDVEGAVDEATQEQQALDDRDIGALLLRDCGSAADTRWIDDRDDLPRLIRAGRHLAQALHPQLRPRDRAARAVGLRRAGGQARGRVGQAGRGLDRPRRG